MHLSDPDYQLSKKFAGFYNELWILDCARRRVDRQFRDKWGYTPTIGGRA